MNFVKPKNEKIFWSAAVAGTLLAFCIFLFLGALKPGRLHLEMVNSQSDLARISIDDEDGKGSREAGTLSLMGDGKNHVYEVDVGNALTKKISIMLGIAQDELRIRKLSYESYLYTRTVACDEIQFNQAVVSGQAACVLNGHKAKSNIDFTVLKKKNIAQIKLKWGILAEGLSYALLVFILIFLAFHVDVSKTESGTGWIINNRSIRLYLLLFFGFASFVYLNLNVSSIGMWKSYIHAEADDGILLGKARAIRSDEWFVQTPFYASQVSNNFSENNPSLGANNIALTATVPVRGLYGYSQARFWGFYTLGFEKGLAWLSAFRIFGLIFSCFVLFAILTKGDFWVSLTGALWILLTPFTQWWFGTNLPDMMIGFAGGVTSLYLLLNAQKIKTAFVAGVVVVISSLTFITALYPPFQIPLVHLALFTVVGLIYRDNLMAVYQSTWKFKTALLMIVMAAIFMFLMLWYQQAISPIELIMNSAYPGKRSSTGGDLALAKEFSGFFSPYLRENRYPAALGNISEAGNFILFFPLVWMVMLLRKHREIRLNPLHMALSTYIVAILLWAYFGYPAWLAKLTLLSMAPANRTLLGLGLASILLTLSVFSSMVSAKKIDNIKKNSAYLLTQVIAIAGVIFWVLFELGQIFPDFVTTKILIVMTVLLTLWSMAFIYGAKALLCTLTLLFSMNGLQVNPLSHSVTALKSAQLASVLQEDRLSGPTMWIVSPEIVHAQYLKANGANVWSGTRFMSDPVQMRMLDPLENYRNIWYRYAHFSIEPLPAGRTSVFELPSTDTVILKIDFCSESLASLGVNRFAFTSQQDLKQMKCLEPLRTNTVEGLWLYKLRLDSAK